MDKLNLEELYLDEEEYQNIKEILKKKDDYFSVEEIKKVFQK